MKKKLRLLAVMMVTIIIFTMSACSESGKSSSSGTENSGTKNSASTNTNKPTSPDTNLHTSTDTKTESTTESFDTDNNYEDITYDNNNNQTAASDTDIYDKKYEEPSEIAQPVINTVPTKPEILEDSNICQQCGGTGETVCTYCNGTVYGEAAGVKYTCSCGGTGKVKCYSCLGKGGSVEYYISSSTESSGLKKIDIKWFDTIWDNYISAEYYNQGISIETYYDFVYTQVLNQSLQIMNGQTPSIINFDIMSGIGGSSADYSGSVDYGGFDDNDYHTSYPGTTCVSCHGEGKVTCPSCGGSGKLVRQKEAPNYSGGTPNYYEVSSRCAACQGSGKVKCLTCNGKGTY